MAKKKSRAFVPVEPPREGCPIILPEKSITLAFRSTDAH